MRIDVLSLFPDMFKPTLGQSWWCRHAAAGSADF